MGKGQETQDRPSQHARYTLRHAATLSHFIAFMEEYSDGKVSAELATQFFHCFKRQTYQTLYIKALSYNFEGFRRSKVEVSNILSDKAAKTRFLELRVYVDNWNVHPS